MQKQQELEKILKDLGASFVGFSNIIDNEAADFPSLNYAVAIGIHLSDAIIEGITDKPTYTYFHHYRTVNSLLDQIALRGVLFLQECGYNAVAVPASQTINDKADPYCGLFSHKKAAVMAGLGRIGRNGLFIHKEYGPRVRLSTILTDMKLDTGSTGISNSSGDLGNASKSLSDVFEGLSNASIGLGDALEGFRSASEDLQNSEYGVNRKYKDIENGNSYSKNLLHNSCGSCNRCVNACPAMALTGKEWYPGEARDEIIDAKACSDYMNRNFKHIGRGSVCGICISVCPAGVKI